MKAYLDQRLKEQYSFQFSKYIGNGFTLTHENIGLQLAFGFLSIAILFVAGLIPILGSLASNLFLSECLNVGFALGVYHFIKTRETTLQPYFGGFKYIGHITLNRLLIFVISLLFVPFLFIGPVGEMISYILESAVQNAEPDPDLVVYYMQNAIGYVFLIGILATFILTPTMFCVFFIVFFKLNAWDALIYSYKFIGKKWLQTFGLVLVASLIFAFGFIMLIIGVFYTYPVMRNILFSCFLDLTAYDRMDTENQIINLTSDDLLDSSL